MLCSLEDAEHVSSSAIVYVRRKADAERVSGELSKRGVPCLFYHGGLEV